MKSLPKSQILRFTEKAIHLARRAVSRYSSKFSKHQDSGPAVIRYLQKDGSVGWEGKAEELMIIYGRFEWKPDNGGTLINRVKERFR